MKFFLQSISSLGAILLGFLLLANAGITSAGRGELESLSMIERATINETINADGTVVEIEELLTLVKSQLAVEVESQADLPYNSTFAKLEVIEAYTITPTGEKIPVAANAIRTVEDDNSKGAAIFSDQKHKIIIFPKVTPGSKTYYKTKLTTYTPLLPGFFYTKLVFSPNQEVKHYEYNLSYPDSLRLYTDIKDVKQVRDEVIDGVRHVGYIYQNLKLKKSEELQVSLNDFAPHIFISSMDSQETFAKAYQERIEPKMGVTPEVQKLADEITKNIKTSGNLSEPKDIQNLQKEQARALYNWVSRNIRYVGIFLGDGGIIPHDVNSIIKNRYGDCKDHNALLIALLSAKGIKASSALINSSNAYTLPKYPVIGPFNHVITYIPAWNLYLDSTAEMAPYGTLPDDELDKPTLLTALGRVGHTPKPKKENNRTVTILTMQIAKDGEIKGKANTQYFGSAEIRARYKYEGADTSLSDRMVSKQLARFRQTGEGSIKTSEVYELDKPFTTDTEFTLDAVANVPGPGAMAIPVGLAPGELASIANSRPPEKFTVPYSCSTRSVTEQYQISFPKNVKVSRIPQNTSYKKGNIEYTASYLEKDNQVTVTRNLEVQRASAVCQPSELQKWKDFYQVFIKDLRSQVFYE
jgi:transglutaminase-like putative cysteine protease